MVLIQNQSLNLLSSRASQLRLPCVLFQLGATRLSVVLRHGLAAAALSEAWALNQPWTVASRLQVAGFGRVVHMPFATLLFA